MKSLLIAGLIGKLDANHEQIEMLLNDRFYTKEERDEKIKECVAKCKELSNAIFEKI